MKKQSMKPMQFVFKLWKKSSEKEKEKEPKKIRKELSSELYWVQDPKDNGRKVLTIAYKPWLLWKGNKVKWNIDRMRRKLGR